MSKRKQAVPVLQHNEATVGTVYLALSLLVLPVLLTNTGLNPLLTEAGVNFLYFCINFFCLSFLLRRFLRESLRYAGKQLWPLLGWSLLGFFLYYSTNLTISLGIRQVFPDFTNQNDAAISGQLQASFWLTAAGTVFLVPFSEELLHRAVVFGSLYKKSPVFAYLFSMLLFAAVHVAGYMGSAAPPVLLVSFLQYLPAGFVLAWSYQRSGCIFVPILIHTAINALGVMTMR